MEIGSISFSLEMQSNRHARMLLPFTFEIHVMKEQVGVRYHAQACLQIDIAIGDRNQLPFDCEAKTLSTTLSCTSYIVRSSTLTVTGRGGGSPPWLHARHDVLNVLSDLVGGLQAEEVEVSQQVVVEGQELEVQLGQRQTPCGGRCGVKRERQKQCEKVTLYLNTAFFTVVGERACLLLL